MPYPAEAGRRRSNDGAGGIETDDFRDVFARDRDRLLYSSAFRRLSGKSQVVGSIELGSFHTRLTHSLKVAQLGRRIAEQFRARNEVDPDTPNPDLVEFACLAHDLGHPPFGHAGESALQSALLTQLQPGPNASEQTVDTMEAHRIRLGSFEGNPQSLRIVTRLAHKWLPTDGESPDIADWFGLDLSAASLDAVSKYPWTRSHEKQEKWGCYGQQVGNAPGDTEVLVWARTLTGAEPVLGTTASKSFEAQLMDWCDDVAYAVHDVEDFFQVGLIPLETLMYEESQHETWEPFRDGLINKWNAKGYKAFDDKPVTVDMLDEARRLLLLEVREVRSPGPFGGTNLERRWAHRRTSRLIKHFMENVTYEGSPSLHRGTFKIAEDPQLKGFLILQCDMLKELIWTYVIGAPNLASQQAGHRRIIRDLVSALSERDGDTLLPTQYRELLESPLVRVGYEDKHLAKLRVVSDYVASLTEQHAYALHRRFTGTDSGGLRDLI